MRYATAADVAAGFRALSPDEEIRCEALLEEAAIIIDSTRSAASDDAKRLVSCRMVRRQLSGGDINSGVPMGATQGTMGALGYSQSWTISAGGAAGELYISKLEKKLLGSGGSVGAVSPLEVLSHA